MSFAAKVSHYRMSVLDQSPELVLSPKNYAHHIECGCAIFECGCAIFGAHSKLHT